MAYFVLVLPLLFDYNLKLPTRSSSARPETRVVSRAYLVFVLLLFD